MALKNRCCVSCGTKFAPRQEVEIGLCGSCFDEFIGGK